MTLARINKWKDGDSGEMVDRSGRVRAFRLSNVSAPEKREAGYDLSRSRSRRLVSERDVVDVEVVGTDVYGRDIIEIKKNGRDVNRILEMKNKLFGVKPKKTKKYKKKK